MTRCGWNSRISGHETPSPPGRAPPRQRDGKTVHLPRLRFQVGYAVPHDQHAAGVQRQLAGQAQARVFIFCRYRQGLSLLLHVGGAKNREPSISAGAAMPGEPNRPCRGSAISVTGESHQALNLATGRSSVTGILRSEKCWVAPVEISANGCVFHHVHRISTKVEAESCIRHLLSSGCPEC